MFLTDFRSILVSIQVKRSMWLGGVERYGRKEKTGTQLGTNHTVKFPRKLLPQRQENDRKLTEGRKRHFMAQALLMMRKIMHGDENSLCMEFASRKLNVRHHA